MTSRPPSDTRTSRTQPASRCACGVRLSVEACCMCSAGGSRRSRGCCVDRLEDPVSFRSLDFVDMVLEERDRVSSRI